MRTWAIIRFVVIAAVVVSTPGCRRGKANAPSAAEIAAERERRQAAVAVLAPRPPPKSTPLLGKAGTDRYGYPLRYVDVPGLRSLLWHKDYAALNRYVEAFQADFEFDYRKEYWIVDAADAFATAEPELRKQLDAWVAATPRSFAPHLARGVHWGKVAFARRGHNTIDKTARADLRTMDEAIQQARGDLGRALALRPKLVAAMRWEIMLAMPRGDDARSRKMIDRALAACPNCFQVRVSYLVTLTPRWGGSYEAMERFARRVDPANEKLKLLAGYPAWDEADQLYLRGKTPQALALAERASSLGDHWQFLLLVARIKLKAKDRRGALADLNKALALRPAHPGMLATRALVHYRDKRWEAAGRDLQQAIQIDRTESRARELLPFVVQGLVYEGWLHEKAGRTPAALRLYDLAAALAPQDRKVQQRRAWLIAGGRAKADIAALETQAKKAPDDFRAVQRLDYALARQRRYDRVVALWNDYLSRKPKDGRAYLERGGAYFNLRRLPEALADAEKSCELGINEGCVRGKQVRRMLGR